MGTGWYWYCWRVWGHGLDVEDIGLYSAHVLFVVVVTSGKTTPVELCDSPLVGLP